MTYAEARAEAQRRADESGFDVGVYAVHGGYSQMLLPAKQHRYGWETQCEVVHCSDLSRCMPGHGPCATRPPSWTWSAG